MFPVNRQCVSSFNSLKSMHLVFGQKCGKGSELHGEERKRYPTHLFVLLLFPWTRQTTPTTSAMRIAAITTPMTIAIIASLSEPAERKKMCVCVQNNNCFIAIYGHDIRPNCYYI